MGVLLQKWLFCSFAFSLLLLLGDLGQPSLSLANDAFAPVDLRQVQVGGEMGRRIDVMVNNNLLALDAEQFLAPFRTKTDTSNYIGLGKLIDAAAVSAAYTKNENMIALKTHLVDVTIENQLSDGYIGLMAPGPSRMWGFADMHEMGYIVSGLMNDYRYFGNQSSLEAARKTADYMIQHWSEKPVNWPLAWGTSPDSVITGVDGAMMRLYRATNDESYLNFSSQQLGLSAWNQSIVVGRTSPYYGHAYVYLARNLAQLDLYRIQPNASLLGQTRRVIDFLTAQDGMTITGAIGQLECWSNNQSGGGELGETCTTAYAIRNYDSMLRLQGDSRYGDLMERTTLNTLYAAQSPDGRQIRYYTPLEGQREYFHLDTYCCPGNFRRIVSELPEMIYYNTGAGLAVNLYTPSEATIALDGGISLEVTQTGDYLNSGQVVLQLDPSQSASFSLQLRIPKWCNDDVSVTINGQAWNGTITPGTFLTIDRQWNAGDEVTIDMPTTWRFVLGRGVQSGLAALMRGPIVYCLDPSQNESLENFDGASMKSLVIDPTSVTDLPGGGPFGGMACQVSATGFGDTFLLKLTQFPDPLGKNVYFHLSDLSVAVPDELVGIFQVPEPGSMSLLISGFLFLMTIAFTYRKRK